METSLAFFSFFNAEITQFAPAIGTRGAVNSFTRKAKAGKNCVLTFQSEGEFLMPPFQLFESGD